MSYLVQGIGREEMFAITLEVQLPNRLRDETQNISCKQRDDDWDRLWTDVGGEG